MKTLSIRLFLLITSLVLVTIPSTIIGLYNTRESKLLINKTHEQELRDQLSLVKNQIELTMNYTDQFVLNDLKFLEMSLEELQGDSPDWTGANEKVMHLASLSNAHYTVFVPSEEGILRKVTSIKDREGNSAEGTYIGKSSEIYQTLIAGITYQGKSFILDSPYIAVYKPLFSDEGELEYVLFSGIPEEVFLKSLLDDLGSRVIGKDGYFFILSPQGEYILSQNRERDGESIIQAQDREGRFFIKEMIDTAMNYKGVGLMHYPWQNGGDKQVREKVASYTYVERLDWILGSSDYLERTLILVAQTRRMLLITILIAMGVGMLFSLFLTQTIYQSFSRLQKNIGSVAEGNLKDQDRRGSLFSEINALQHSMHSHMIPKLQDLIGNMEDKADQTTRMSEVLGYNIDQTLHSIDQVDLSSGRVKVESEKLTTLMSDSRKSTEAIALSVKEYQDMVHTQNESVAEISASIEESGASLNNVSRVVSEKLEAAGVLARQGEEGQESVDITNDLITQISEDVTGLLDILHIINDITDQTQLLAMNASIEAAHAGNQGKGFSIVAGEMRQLAESTSLNGKKIEESLKDITSRIGTASDQSNKTRLVISEMTGNLKEFARAFREIADSTQEISLGTTQILEAVSILSDLSEKNYHTGHRIQESVEQLNGAIKNTEKGARNNENETDELKHFIEEVVTAQKEMKNLGSINKQIGKELREELENFIYNELSREESLLDIIRAHQLWVERVESHISGELNLNPHELGDHKSCALGHWLETISGTELAQKKEIALLNDHHEQLHQLVKEITLSKSTNMEKSFLHLKEHSHNVIHYLLASLQAGI
ncbi:MAG: Cache 3/Cache 2 fusion domain-containing protein [Spirochaetales bacterium]|nr:Cache 3/Cache 2 fusion domain-containing protein [Spirochaetales bacterium]